MLTFAAEPLDTVWEHKLACAQEHWPSTLMYANGGTLDMKLERYLDYERAGMFREYVARHDGEFAGCCGLYFTVSMFTQEPIATEDFIYLKPEFRTGRNGYRFYQFIVDEARRSGVMSIVVTAPPNSAADKILGTLGGALSAHQYIKSYKEH